MDRKVISSALLMLYGSLSGMAQTPATEAVPDSLMGATYDDLQEVVVSATKQVVKSDGEKLTYDMEQDNTSKGQNLLDVLRKVPMVQVDGQDNITIKGSSNFKIYVNGREDQMLTSNYQRVFKAMPAESVQKIEVITEPGAKYDAEGVGGILNLVTEKKQTKEGYAGTVSVSASNRDLGGSLYGRMKYGNVTADANVNYNDGRPFSQTNTNDNITTDEASDLNYRQVSEGRQRFGYYFLGGGLNLSWEPNEKNLFTVGANVFDMQANIKDFTQTTRMYSRDGEQQWGIRQSYGGYMKNLSASANTSYLHKFNDKGQNLVITYFFDFGRGPLSVLSHNENELNRDWYDGYMRTYNCDYDRSHTVTADYTLPLKEEKHTIEAGAKGIFRRNTADSHQLNGKTEDTLVEDKDNSFVTRQIQNVYALYAAYTGVFGPVTAKGGVRYEHTYMGMDFLSGNMDNFRRKLDNVVPNAAVTYNFSMASSLRLAYQMRISRPSLSQLNPFRQKIQETEVEMGNPNLRSEEYHNLSLTYSNYGMKFGGNVQLSGSQSNNTIEEYLYYEESVKYQTFGNLGKRRRVELSGYFNYNITSDMRLSLYGGINFTSLKSGDDKLRNHGWNGNLGGSWNYTGPWKLKFGAYGGWNTGDISLQGKWCGYHYYGVSVGRSFLKEDALTVTVNANNFLSDHSTFKNKSWADGRYSVGHWRNRNWQVGVTLSWNFGHLTDRVKSTGAETENDDLKSTGNKQGQGGGVSL